MNPFLTASLLGLKHALDPDHLAATLNMTTSGKLKTRSAAKLGLSWGVGHATSMFVLGLPVVLFTSSLPSEVYTGAELAIGLVIIWLGLQLFLQWFKGEFHPHNLEKFVKEHDHSHHKGAHRRAGLMGLLHGVGGSYPGALLMLASFSTAASAAVGLILFTLLSILSMTLVTTSFSFITINHLAMHVMDRLIIPIMFIITVWFGFNYAIEAIKALGIL